MQITKLIIMNHFVKHGLDLNILSNKVLNKLIDKGFIITNKLDDHIDKENSQLVYNEESTIDDFNFDEFDILIE